MMRQAKRSDKKCGASYIPNTAKCSKGSGVGTAVKAVAAAGVVAGGVAAIRGGAIKTLGSYTRKRISKERKLKMSGKFLNSMKPLSKTQRLAETAKKANVSAEQAIKRAKEAEINRIAVVGEAMYKSGKATKASLKSGTRRHRLTVEKARRKFEPGYRGKRRGLGSFYKDGHARTKSVRDRMAKIMDSYKKPRY